MVIHNLYCAVHLSGSVASRTGHRFEQPHGKWKAGFGRGRHQSEN